MKRFLVIVAALLTSTISLAQYRPVGAITLWTDGYVVTLNRDTLRGDVRVGSLLNDSPASIFIRAADGTKTKVKGEQVQLLVQQFPNFAYATGSIPRERKQVIFERVPNPRRNEKPMLLERLTPPGGSIALYFDAAGWKKTTEYTFGNFVFEANYQDLSYICLKYGSEAFVAKRGALEAVYDRLFGDCPVFMRAYPVVARRDWNWLGNLVAAYSQLCVVP